MKFKKGDIVICIEPDDNFLIKGNFYEVLDIINDFLFNYITLKETDDMQWRPDRFELPIHDCKLNRALYPELKPKNGYLIKR